MSYLNKIKIPLTPIIMGYLMEYGKATKNDLTKISYLVSSKLQDTDMRVDAVFRGHLHNPDLGIESETIDFELYYWTSNKFITEIESQSNDMYLELVKKEYFKEYSINSMYHNRLDMIDWKSENNYRDFVRILSKIIFSNPPNIK